MSTLPDDPMNQAAPPTPSMADRREMLIDSWFDGMLADDQLAELETSLLESSEARQEFWERATVHGLLREAAKLRFSSADFGVTSAEPTSPPSVGERAPLAVCAAAWRQLPLAVRRIVLVAGWLAAVLIASRGIASSNHTGGAKPAAVVLHEEGFETPPPPAQDFQPEHFDLWGGDETEVVGVTDGVVPRGGARMLKFVSGHPRDTFYEGVVAEIWRFVDLAELRASAGGRLDRVELSAFFNAAQTGDVVKPFGGVSLIATDTHPRDFRRDWRAQFAAAAKQPASMAASEIRQDLDSDRRTWQRLSATVDVPEGARYLVLHCFTERWRNDGERLVWESMGQYVDDIRLEVVPAALPRPTR
jgi:hypothetical protein